MKRKKKPNLSSGSLLASSEASTDIVLAGEESRSLWANRKLRLPVKGGVWALVDQLCLHAMTRGAARERCIVAGKRNRDGERETERERTQHAECVGNGNKKGRFC